MVVIEFDYRNEAGAHSVPPADIAEQLNQAAGKFPGNLLLTTPRGGRTVFVLGAIERDCARYQLATRGALALMSEAFTRLGLGNVGGGGLEVDAAATDLARMFFSPRATVHGEKRRGEIRILCEAPFNVEALATHAPVPPSRKPRARRATEASSRFAEAAKNWNRDHAQDFGPPGAGSCPACGHHGCFGRIPDHAEKWTCFSSGHEATGCGRPGVNAGWFGDVLDLAAYSRRCSRTDVLRADGYLIPDARDEPGARHLSSRWLKSPRGRSTP